MRSWLPVALLILGFATPTRAEWQPDKPVRIIVPWSAGGSTDQLIRILAVELGEALKQKVIVVNQPGGAGAVGTKAVLLADRDGYTWAAGATKDLGTYAVTGALDTHLEDWHLYLAVSNYTILSAGPSAPFNSVDDVIQAMHSRPDTVTIATGGINSAGGASAESLKVVAGGDYKMLSYDGGNAAVLATISGETALTTQLVSDQYEMLRVGRLKPLGAFTPSAVSIAGVGTIPPITAMLPNLNTATVHFGIWAPKGTPAEVIDTMNEIWDTLIPQSARLQRYADSKGLTVDVMRGETAFERVFPATRVYAWQLHDGGMSKVNPADVGIPRPGARPAPESR